MRYNLIVIMKKFALLLFSSVVLLSCTSSVSEADLAKLNGYWEIESVKMPNGGEKDYVVNPTIDFFELKGKTGIRKKVMPQLDGKYLVNDLSEKITISQTEHKMYINYTTQYAKWKEEIVALDDDELVLKNDHDMEYHYKKPIPFTVK